MILQLLSPDVLEPEGLLLSNVLVGLTNFVGHVHNNGTTGHLIRYTYSADCYHKSLVSQPHGRNSVHLGM